MSAYLSPAQAAEILGCSARSILRAISRGDLPAVAYGAAGPYPPGGLRHVPCPAQGQDGAAAPQAVGVTGLLAAFIARHTNSAPGLCEGLTGAAGAAGGHRGAATAPAAPTHGGTGRVNPPGASGAAHHHP